MPPRAFITRCQGTALTIRQRRHRIANLSSAAAYQLRYPAVGGDPAPGDASDHAVDAMVEGRRLRHGCQAAVSHQPSDEDYSTRRHEGHKGVLIRSDFIMSTEPS